MLAKSPIKIVRVLKLIVLIPFDLLLVLRYFLHLESELVFEIIRQVEHRGSWRLLLDVRVDRRSRLDNCVRLSSLRDTKRSSQNLLYAGVESKTKSTLRVVTSYEVTYWFESVTP